MIPSDKLEAVMEATHRKLHTHGEVTWQRFADWTKPQKPPGETRGGGVEGGRTDSDLKERLLDRQAGRYQAELSGLTRRLHTDLMRLQDLIRIANPDTPVRDIGGGCRSCSRDGGRYEPTASKRYATACRFCGDWRGEHGDWPPLAVVRWRGNHPGKKVPLSVVEQTG